ncbi:DNA phosphorothioation-dependent restriction protein DptF [Oceanobacillus polygoni]|uniref:DNA phosphorothioation-dependent restriction protein DptF n=1 Tax=Oceanobacillus polygoni TaxID=1235259 RepID=A0A9X0YWR5_9BACI|nr:DNA phosphorothioation-dependent restriction protein DptF [Oceanobacillus polygoni]MBP2079461.1 DNA phosphorothioation-dependent restriction protein DptF [Oceanobacillus polygoni]
MDNNNFSFLESGFPKLAALGSEIESIFYKDSQTVLMKGRLFAEELLNEVILQYEDLNNLKYMKLYERIQYLEKDGILNKEIAKSFDTIRQLGNKSSHEYVGMDLENAFKIHKRLFEISVWLMELYGDYSFVAPMYKIPEIKQEMDYIVQLEEKTSSLERKIELILQESTRDYYAKDELAATYEEESRPVQLLKHKENQQLDYEDSYLLKELSKLKESSQEAIENSNEFSSFKEYLHVERSIQGELKESLDKAATFMQSQLILLCGSVGDGKSHLLAYIKHKYPELINQFDIHNDATESFDPHKSSLDTLADRLSPFNDTQIENSSTKLILAINLGVLNNFIESEYAKDNFKILSKFIEKAKVFEATEITTKQESDYFHLISFSDYQPFQLTEEVASSDYYATLLEKITQPIDNNPFYRAYKLDEERNIRGFFMNNYELLMLSETRETIINLLIQSHIKYKVIISTRSLLNFIYDILVPENIDVDYINADASDKTKGLLFNLIFEGKDRSQLLSTFEKLDPIHNRSNEMDLILIELNNSMQIINTFEKYINLSNLVEWKNELEGMGAFQSLTESSRQLYNRTLFRMIYFIGSNEMKNVFVDDAYNEYLNFLYHFNKGDRTGLRKIQSLVHDSIFLWNGTPKDRYIYINSNNEHIQIAQSLEIKPFFNHLRQNNDTTLERFQLSILLALADQNKENPEFLDIDYPLYEMIIRLSRGYRPNKKDEENYIQYVKFIDRLMQHGKRKKELLFVNHQTDMMFRLNYDDDYEEYSFRRD